MISKPWGPRASAGRSLLPPPLLLRCSVSSSPGRKKPPRSPPGGQRYDMTLYVSLEQQYVLVIMYENTGGERCVGVCVCACACVWDIPSLTVTNARIILRASGLHAMSLKYISFKCLHNLYSQAPLPRSKNQQAMKSTKGWDSSLDPEWIRLDSLGILGNVWCLVCTISFQLVCHWGSLNPSQSDGLQSTRTTDIICTWFFGVKYVSTFLRQRLKKTCVYLQDLQRVKPYSFKSVFIFLNLC